MLFSKGLVRGNVIGADAIEGNVQGVKLRNSITEFRCFDRSPVGVIFGVGKDHIALSQQLRRRYFTCLIGRQHEAGHGLAGFQHNIFSLYCLRYDWLSYEISIGVRDHPIG